MDAGRRRGRGNEMRLRLTFSTYVDNPFVGSDIPQVTCTHIPSCRLYQLYTVIACRFFLLFLSFFLDRGYKNHSSLRDSRPPYLSLEALLVHRIPSVHIVPLRPTYSLAPHKRQTNERLTAALLRTTCQLSSLTPKHLNVFLGTGKRPAVRCDCGGHSRADFRGFIILAGRIGVICRASLYNYGPLRLKN